MNESLITFEREIDSSDPCSTPLDNIQRGIKIWMWLSGIIIFWVLAEHIEIHGIGFWVSLILSGLLLTSFIGFIIPCWLFSDYVKAQNLKNHTRPIGLRQYHTIDNCPVFKRSIGGEVFDTAESTPVMFKEQIQSNSLSVNSGAKYEIQYHYLMITNATKKLIHVNFCLSVRVESLCYSEMNDPKISDLEIYVHNNEYDAMDDIVNCFGENQFTNIIEREISFPDRKDAYVFKMEDWTA